MKLPCRNCITFAICKARITKRKDQWLRIYRDCTLIQKSYNYYIFNCKSKYLEGKNKQERYNMFRLTVCKFFELRTK